MRFACVLIAVWVLGFWTAALAQDDAPAETKDGEFLESLFSYMPVAFGGPLADLRRTLMRLSEKPDPALDLNFLSATEAVDALPIMTDDKKFIPHRDMKPLFTIGGHPVRGAFRLQQEKDSLTGEKLPYKPGDPYMPAGFDYNPDFRLFQLDTYYSELQPAVFFAIEF